MLKSCRLSSTASVCNQTRVHSVVRDVSCKLKRCEYVEKDVDVSKSIWALPPHVRQKPVKHLVSQLFLAPFQHPLCARPSWSSDIGRVTLTRNLARTDGIAVGSRSETHNPRAPLTKCWMFHATVWTQHWANVTHTPPDRAAESPPSWSPLSIGVEDKSG